MLSIHKAKPRQLYRVHVQDTRRYIQTPNPSNTRSDISGEGDEKGGYAQSLEQTACAGSGTHEKEDLANFRCAPVAIYGGERWTRKNTQRIRGNACRKFCADFDPLPMRINVSNAMKCSIPSSLVLTRGDPRTHSSITEGKPPQNVRFTSSRGIE